MPRFVLITILMSFFTTSALSQAPLPKVPYLPREFRGVWVSTVSNLDWPSRKGLPVADQKRELIAMLDRADALNLNAVILQVRPAGDAFYQSKYDPWSPFLTGTMGQAPQPLYDPLQFAIGEAHKRGLELHAWFNPYRALTSVNQETSPNHITKKRPDLIVTYGSNVIMNPGEQEVIDYNVAVVMDVVRRYDVDGVQFDDYFYPYPESGKTFNDAAAYKKYTASGGTLGLDDWRRDNVNRFVERVYTEIKQVKPHVKFGVSPFGIWKSGVPPQIKGLSSYDAIYADSRKWLEEGWLDYLAPQLYWPIESSGQSFPVLVNWWDSVNPKNRYIWPGLATYKIGSGKDYSPREIINQINITNQKPTTSGHIHFRMNWLSTNKGKVSDALRAQSYTSKALVPPLSYIDSTKPMAPNVMFKPAQGNEPASLQWRPLGDDAVKNWVVYASTPTGWWADVLPVSQTAIPITNGNQPAIMAVSAIDLAGNESPRAIVRGN